MSAAGTGAGTASGTDPEEVVDALERDLRSLLREAAEARFQAAESERQHALAERKWLLGLIDVQDALERVFRSVEAKPDRVTDQMKVWLGNFRAVGRLLDRQLADRGARRIPRDGDTFDPARQTILDTVEDAAREDGTVVEELRPGWERGGEVLRKAEVRVVRNGD